MGLNLSNFAVLTLFICLLPIFVDPNDRFDICKSWYLLVRLASGGTLVLWHGASLGRCRTVHRHSRDDSRQQRTTMD